MRRTRDALGLLLAALIAAAGCSTSDAHLKPPKHPEEYNVPPESDLRYSKPPDFPKETMQDDYLLNKAKKDKQDAGQRGFSGGMNGAGGGPR